MVSRCGCTAWGSWGERRGSHIHIAKQLNRLNQAYRLSQSPALWWNYNITVICSMLSVSHSKVRQKFGICKNSWNIFVIFHEITNWFSIFANSIIWILNWDISTFKYKWSTIWNYYLLHNTFTFTHSYSFKIQGASSLVLINQDATPWLDHV